MLNGSVFAPKTMQVEFWVNVPSSQSNDFPRVVSDYVSNSNNGFVTCIRQADSAFPEDAAISNGRIASATEDEPYISTTSTLVPWVAGALIGAFALIAMIVLFIFGRQKAGKTYPEEEYEQPEPPENVRDPNAPLSEDEELELMAM